MPGNLGQRSAVGALSQANRVTPGGWVVTYTPEMMPSDSEFEVWHGMIIGPGGYFLVYIDDAGFGVGENGKINEYSPKTPMFVRKGQTITLNWSISTGAAPVCWLYFRQPEVGRV